MPGNWQQERGRCAMTELKRVDEGLAPEVAALAKALRDLFLGLGVSTRRYAARRSYDCSTVSRYLGGQRMPRWEFVLNLLHDVAEERGTVPTEETIGMLRELHTAALQQGNSPVHAAQLLEQRLAQADQEVRRAAMRERMLEDTLQDREHRIRDLQLRYRELQASSGPLASEPPASGAGDEGTAAEQVRLRAEIRDLQDELGRVRALHREAEERCEQLERQLMEAEGAVAVAVEREGTAPAGIFPREGSGVQTTITGDVMITNTLNGWRGDEGYVRSRSVQVFDEAGFLRGSGLLVDAWTVVTVGDVVPPGRLTHMFAGGSDHRVKTSSVEFPDLAPGALNLFAVLRLSGPLPAPEQPLAIDTRPVPGSQLLVSTEARNGPFSCLLMFKGRSGALLRVAGEFERGIAGAPAFADAGSVVGLVGHWASPSESDRGSLFPVADLLASLTTGA